MCQPYHSRLSAFQRYTHPEAKTDDPFLSTPVAQWVLEVQHRLKQEALSPTQSPITRQYLLRYLDLWFFVVDCLHNVDSLIYLTNGRWNPENYVHLNHSPCIHTLHPLPTYTAYAQRHLYSFSDSKMSGTEESEQPLLVLLRYIWSNKYKAKDFGDRFRKCLYTKGQQQTLGSWYIECLVMYALGAYSADQTPCLDFELRQELCRWWRHRFLRNVFVRDGRLIAAHLTLELFAAMKDFMFFVTRAYATWGKWLDEHMDWTELQKNQLQMGNAYRLALGSHQKGIRSLNDIEGVRELYQVKWTRVPRDFWDAHTRLIKEDVVENTSWLDVHMKSIQEAATSFFQRRVELLAYAPTVQEWKIARFYNIRECYTLQFVQTYRFLLLVGVHYYLKPEDIEPLLAHCVMHYSNGKTRKTEFRANWKNFSLLYPSQARLLQIIINTYRELQLVSAHPLPAHWFAAQISAMEERSPVESYNTIHRCDYLLFCPVCKDMRSNVTQFRTRGAARIKNFDPHKTAGFFTVAVDASTGKLFCNRKHGLKKKECRRTELKCIPLVGKWVNLYSNTYVLCGQKECGNIIQLDTQCHYNGTLYSTMRANDRGLFCARCLGEHIKESRRRKKKVKEVAPPGTTPARSASFRADHTGAKKIKQLSQSLQLSTRVGYVVNKKAHVITARKKLK